MSSSEPKRMKRIEYRGKHLRASRTGGLSLRAQTKASGVNLTVNSRHGLRVSKRIAKGTNIALQNGHLRIQGRYGKGPTKLNVSKSGFSISTKNELGTFNWIKPRYSSATIAGINVRGRNALMVYGLGDLEGAGHRRPCPQSPHRHRAPHLEARPRAAAAKPRPRPSSPKTALHPAFDAVEATKGCS